MGEEHSPANHNPKPVLTMLFPHATNHQLITDMANSAREVLQLTSTNRNGDLQACHACRIHELMRHRSHTVITD